MKIAMGLMALLFGAGLTSLAAEEHALPVQPVSLLPGISSRASTANLPPEVITDLTNAPNPFDARKAGLLGQTQLSYSLTGDYTVSVTLYDLFGMRVRSWEFKPGDNGGRAGANTVLWDGTNEAGRKVSKGGYIAELQIETPQTTVTAIRKIGVID